MKKPKRSGKVYRCIKWNLLVVAIALLIVTIISINKGISWYVSLVSIPVLGWTIWYMVLVATQKMLIVHETGLEYRFGSASVMSRWENIKAITLIQDEGVVLTCHIQEQRISNQVDERLVKKYTKNGFLPLSNIVYVPLKMSSVLNKLAVDKKNFMKTSFGRELLHYAPDLFVEPSNEKLIVTQGGNARIRRRERRHNRRVKSEWQVFSSLKDFRENEKS